MYLMTLLNIRYSQGKCMARWITFGIIEICIFQFCTLQLLNVIVYVLGFVNRDSFLDYRLEYYMSQLTIT
jgi:hypothetical protein